MWTRTPNTWIYRPFYAGRPIEAPIQRTAPPPDASGRGSGPPGWLFCRDWRAPLRR